MGKEGTARRELEQSLEWPRWPGSTNPFCAELFPNSFRARWGGGSRGVLYQALLSATMGSSLSEDLIAFSKMCPNLQHRNESRIASVLVSLCRQIAFLSLESWQANLCRVLFHMVSALPY